MKNQFSRKHYETIAATLRDLHDSPSTTPEQASGVRLTALKLSYAFSYDNPRFDRPRFLKAAWGADYFPATSAPRPLPERQAFALPLEAAVHAGWHAAPVATA